MIYLIQVSQNDEVWTLNLMPYDYLRLFPIPELAYATNILIQIYKHLLGINPTSNHLGFDNPQEHALYYTLKDEMCRIKQVSVLI